SETLKDHNEAVANWRKVEKEIRARQAAENKKDLSPDDAATAAAAAAATAGAIKASAEKVPLPKRKPKKRKTK
ncbi:MAG: aminodeoxychorismate lyase, partial [Hyphomicrobiaceae bacterium]